jgi:cyclic-di-GMP phosphodiesterase TipF (flagellum assembly factor)
MMIRLSALLVAICMVLIAGSFGLVLYLTFGVTGAEAAVVALAALTGLAVYNAAATRFRYQSELSGQIGDLSRGTADLARQVGEQGRRLATLEKTSDNAIQKAIAASQPLQGELNELGTMLRQLAQNVALQDAAIRALSTQSAGATLVPEAPPAAPANFSMPDVGAQKVEVEAPELAAPMKLSDTVADGPFRGMTGHAVVSTIRDAINENRIDVYLQPIVTLPQRKVRYYEALVRLRLTDKIVAAADFISYAEAGNVVAGLDYLMLARCVRILRRLQTKTKDVGVFCNISAQTLSDRDVMAQIIDFAEANQVLAPVLAFELPYPSVRAMGPRENESLARLTDLGFRLSVDHIGDLRFDARDLADRKCTFMKIPAAVLLGRTSQASSDIHPADISGLLSRNGIELIAEKVESEANVVDLLDYDLKFAQGNLFSPPRPVKQETPEAIAEPAAPQIAAAPSTPVPAPPLNQEPAPVRLPTVEPPASLTTDTAPAPGKNMPTAEFTLSAMQEKTELKTDMPLDQMEPKSAPNTTERGTTIDRNSALARLAKIVARP